MHVLRQRENYQYKTTTSTTDGQMVCHRTSTFGVKVLKWKKSRIERIFCARQFSKLKRMDSLPTFIIKKGRSYMSLCTKRLQFLDLTNFLGAGTSLKSFYKAYKVTQGKGLFPYSWFLSLDKLGALGLPARDPLFRKALDTGDEEAIKRLMPYDPFYDILHLNTISNEDFDECHNEYRRLGMKKFGDYVKYYNNLDFTGMVEGLEKMAKIYEDHGLVMLKDAVSLPRLSQKIIFRSLTEDNYFVCFDKQHKYIFQELRDKIVGGPSIIFTRYAEAGVTRIRNGPELCKTVEGWDANSLYLWGTGKKQCTGPYTLLEKKYGYRKHTKVKGARGLKYSQKGVNWINFLQEERGYYIRTAENHCLGEKRILNFCNFHEFLFLFKVGSLIFNYLNFFCFNDWSFY